MDEIRSWWEVPCIAHFCHIFAKPFKIVDFEIEELEDTLLLDEVKDDPTPSLLVQVYCALLNGIVDKEVTMENWEFFLKMHLEWRNEYLDEKWNPHANKEYKELSTRTKVEILHRICHWRMELDDIGDLLRGIDGPTLRADPIGKDDEGNIYWYFYGTRLYLETAKKKPPRKTKQDQAKGRGKGKGTPKTNRRSAQIQDEDEEETQDEGGVWKMVCSTIDEWEELVENLKECRKGDGRRLYKFLNDELLPDVTYSLQQKEKLFKKKLLAELPRRTSDRLAQKAVEKQEEMLEALVREQQREEHRRLEAEEQAKRDEEAEKRHNEKLEEVIRRRKVKEEEQTKQRQEEEKNWSLALSGELSGPRQAALGAVQGVVQTQQLIDVDDKDDVLYTAMYKVLAGLRRHEDGWVFEEPVTEDIAPGYFDVVSKPMDFVTVEKNIEKGTYTTKDQFSKDVEQIFENCKIYNGEESEYYELADEMIELFQKLLKEHFIEEILEKEEETEDKKGKKRHSPSPELTSESSEESEEEDDLDDDDLEQDEEAKKAAKKRKKLLKPNFEMGIMAPGGGSGMVIPQRIRYPPPPRMMHPGMRPLPPEMMGYPHFPPPYGPAPPYPHPMHMRPPPPREMFYPPPDFPRYPYRMNGAPPPYRPPMFPPDHPMASHPMHQQMGTPPAPKPLANGPIQPRPPNQPHPPKLPESALSLDKESGQQVSSPRVSSTVQTPPTSGDERGDEADESRGKSEPVNTEEEKKENDPNAADKDQINQPHPPHQEQPRPPLSSQANQTHSPYPIRPHGMVRGEYPSPHMMSPEQYRYHQAMLAHQHRQMAMTHGYPPDPAHPMWNGRPAYYGSHHQQQPQHPAQMAMMERQKRAYWEYQMRMQMRAAAAMGSPKQTSESDGKDKATTAASSGDKKDEDIPDYHDSLTRYAMGLAKGEEGQETMENSQGDGERPQEEKSQEQRPREEKPQGEKDATETKSPSHKEKTVEQAKRDVPARPPPSSRQWPHPSHYSMMSNGYGGQMPPPHPQYGAPPPPHMYGGPHPSQMGYPPYPDPSYYGNGGGPPMMPQEMERWRYMEMQRQWMAAQQRPHPQSSPHLMKRPHPSSQDDHVTQNSESHDTSEPPNKQHKAVNQTQETSINKLSEA